MYDASTLYVQVHAYDKEPNKIVSYLTRRDADSPSDWIRVLVDSFHDRRSAFEFAVNPAGVKQDAYWFNDGDSYQGWDAVWEVAVNRSPTGWRAEFRIPFSQLRFQPAAKTTLVPSANGSRRSSGRRWRAQMARIAGSQPGASARSRS